MKTTKHILLTALLCAGSTLAQAHDFEAEGVYYLRTSENTVAVTFEGEYYYNISERKKYAGDVVIPPSVTFDGVTYSVTAIGDYAFDSCGDLTAVSLPDGITTIGEFAFEACSNLTALTLPSTVTTIKGFAFVGCDALTQMTIPASVTTIGTTPLSACAGLTALTVEEGNSQYDSRDGCNAIIETATGTLIAGCRNSVIPAGVTAIADEAFSRCVGLTTLDLPASVATIGNRAFNGCTGLTQLVIPDGVTTIGQNAFASCGNITALTIGRGVTTIDDLAFDGCKSLTTVEIPDNVRTLGEGAFRYCSALTTATLPRQLTSLSSNLFAHCQALTAVTIPSSVTTIGDDAFGHCSSLAAIDIPSSVTTIGDDAFEDCTALTTMTIPASVSAIGNLVFRGCNGMKQLTVDSQNARYDSRDGCNAIVETETNTLISGCQTTVIPASVTTIGAGAFSGCKSLTYIYIPSNVTAMEYGAFAGCDNLTAVKVEWAEPIKIDRSIFSNRKNTTLYVPVGTKAAYEAADYWKEFKEIVEGEPEPVGDVLWSGSEEIKDWSCLYFSAEEVAQLNIGDVLHVAVTAVAAEDAFVVLNDGRWAGVEDWYWLSPESAEARFTLTGDIVRALKATGIVLTGNGYTITSVYTTPAYTGTEASVWLGQLTDGDTYISHVHFSNANSSEGVAPGDIIRLTYTKEDDNWLKLFCFGEETGWEWKSFDNLDITLTETGADVVVTSDMAPLLNKNALIVQGSNICLTQVELIETNQHNTPDEPNKCDLNGDGKVDMGDVLFLINKIAGQAQ